MNINPEEKFRRFSALPVIEGEIPMAKKDTCTTAMEDIDESEAVDGTVDMSFVNEKSEV